MIIKNRSQQIIIFCLFSFFLLIGFAFAQEVVYPAAPEAPAPTTRSLLPDYVKYIFNLTIAMVGIIAFGVLVFAGFRYLTSAGKTEIISSAKNQIKSAFLGVIILLFSYIILTTINPQLIILPSPILEEISLPTEPVTPDSPQKVYPNILWRITEIAVSVKEIIEGEKGIKNTAQTIKSLTDKCDCKNTNPLCACKIYRGGSCESLNCYSQKETEPCPDWQKIEGTRQKTIASMFDVLYYRNRATNEREDFLLDIKDLSKEVSYYEERIKAETEYLAKIEGEYGRLQQQSIIEELEKIKNKLKNKQNLYEILAEKLKELSELIEKISQPAKNISKLPDDCLTNVKNKCRGSCSGGCHDTEGCFPAGCSGGNPCPTNEIENKLKEINSIGDKIKVISDEIIEIIKNIISL